MLHPGHDVYASESYSDNGNIYMAGNCSLIDVSYLNTGTELDRTTVEIIKQQTVYP